MTVIELKEKLIAQINGVDDAELLEEVSKMIAFEQNIEDAYVMSDDERLAVQEGIDQIKNGQYLSHDEANKKVDECLKKYAGR